MASKNFAYKAIIKQSNCLLVEQFKIQDCVYNLTVNTWSVLIAGKFQRVDNNI